MEYQLKVRKKLVLSIHAKDTFSDDYLVVNTGEVFSFNVDLSDYWRDWFIKTNADGFNNIFLRDKDKRLPGSKCFKLCGTLEQDENNHFPIGTSLNWTADKTGRLHFFANDSKKLNKKGQFKYYNNNKGSITLKIVRLS